MALFAEPFDRGGQSSDEGRAEVRRGSIGQFKVDSDTSLARELYPDLPLEDAWRKLHDNYKIKHEVDNIAFYGGAPSVRVEFTLDPNNGRLIDWAKREISAYAGTNDKEAIAETFMVYTDRKFNREFPADIKALLDEYIEAARTGHIGDADPAGFTRAFEGDDAAIFATDPVTGEPLTLPDLTDPDK